MTNNIDIDVLLEGEASQPYVEEVKLEILEAQNNGITVLEFVRSRLDDAFPPVSNSGTAYNVAWFKAYLHKHCHGWKITGSNSPKMVRITENNKYCIIKSLLRTRAV